MIIMMYPIRIKAASMAKVTSTRESQLVSNQAYEQVAYYNYVF